MALPPEHRPRTAHQVTQVVRSLIRPASPDMDMAGTDPWLPANAPQVRWSRRKEKARRVAGVAVLLGLALLAALLLLPLLLVLGIGTALDSQLAGILLGAVLLLGLLGAAWTGRRAMKLIQSPLPAPEPAADDEGQLLALLHQHERALPPPTRSAFRSTVIATRDALRATAQEGTLSRDAFDARQAVRQDLPDLLGSYQSLPPGAARDQELLQQLQLIETRMQEVRLERGKQQERQLQAHGNYLREKYQPETDS